MTFGKALSRFQKLFAGRPSHESTPIDEPIKLPCHVIAVHWEFTSSLDVLEWDLTINVDPGTSVGEYLALFNGSIDGAGCYLGLQTDVNIPQAGRGIGKGLIFSTWWSFDDSDTRIPVNGFIEMGSHEGNFVGVRRPYQWTTGVYRVTLSRSEPEIFDGQELDWFDLAVTELDAASPTGARPEPIGPNEWIGGLRFPRKTRGKAATVDPGGLLFLEVYSGARTWAEVRPWQVDVMAYGNGTRCPSGTTEYSTFPFGQQMPNANVRYDTERGSVDISFGVGVLKENPAGAWP
jgi:hypothetical protein